MQKGKYTAILVDDEKWTRDVLRCMGRWEELGIELVAEASDGDCGLELAMRIRPDIILSDVKMPNMDGLTFLDTLRKGGSRAKVIFVSGYDEFTYVRNAVRLQAMDYLLKPVKPEELNEQLRRCVEELKREESTRAAEELDLRSVFQAEWFGAYMELRQGIYEALRSRNRESLERRFFRLEELIREKEGENPPRETAVYVYYDLYNLLSGIIADSEYSLEEVWDKREETYVFGRDFSFSGMIRAMESLAEKTGDRLEQLRREKHRLDLKAVRRYVDANYAADITLEETANRFYVSKEYLSKVFKTETGMGFSGYVTDRKMKKAGELLKEGAAIKEIAEMLGYKEIGHFYKVFKKYYGVTPGEMLHKIKS